MYPQNRLLRIPSKYYQDLEQKILAESSKKDIVKSAKSLQLFFFKLKEHRIDT